MEREVVQRSLISGSLALALILFATRWGSYLGVGPLRFGDVLVICAFIHFGMTRLFAAHLVRTVPPLALQSIGLLIAYATCRFLLSSNFDFESVRDAVPYTLYAALGLIAGLTVVNADRERTYKLFFGAMSLHVVWVIYGRFIDKDGISTGDPLSPLLLVRPDIDYPLIGVFAALLLVTMNNSTKWRTTCAFGFVVCCGLLLAAYNRAALVGGVLAIAVAVWLILYSRRAKGISYVIAALVPLVIMISIPILQSTQAGTRLMNSFGSSTSVDAEDNGEGTTNARTQAWKRLYRWLRDDQDALIVGTGFSMNVMAESGADRDLDVAAGEVYQLRAPHNGWLGALAHLGIVGVLLLAIPVGMFFAAFWRLRRSLVDDPFLLLVFLVPIALFFPITVGVILESPFGAVPFWWCTGVALAIAYQKPDRHQRDEVDSHPHAMAV